MFHYLLKVFAITNRYSQLWSLAQICYKFTSTILHYCWIRRNWAQEKSLNSVTSALMSALICNSSEMSHVTETRSWSRVATICTNRRYKDKTGRCTRNAKHGNLFHFVFTSAHIYITRRKNINKIHMRVMKTHYSRRCARDKTTIN